MNEQRSAVSSIRRRIGRAATTSLAVGGLIGVGMPLTAAPAQAASAFLDDQLSTCTGTDAAPFTTTLDADYTDTGSLTVNCHAVVDLAGFDVDVQGIVITPGNSLVLTDTSAVKAAAGTVTTDVRDVPHTAGIQTSGAELVITGNVDVFAFGGSDILSGAAGIGGVAGDDAGTVTISGNATVEAVGNNLGAGIGGGWESGSGGGDGGIVNITDNADVIARVVVGPGANGSSGIGGGRVGGAATVTIDGSAVVTATGSRNGSGIGAGSGPGDTLVIGGNAQVTASAPPSYYAGGSTALGVADELHVYGTITIRDSAIVRVPSGEFVILDTNTTAGAAGAEVVLQDDALLTGSSDASPSFGQITGDGDIDNGGIILFPAASVAADIDVFDHHYAVSFDNGPSADANPAGATFYAASFDDAGQSFPAANPTPPAGSTFVEWNTGDDATGTTMTAVAALPGGSADGAVLEVDVFAIYAFDDPDVNLAISGTPRVGQQLTASIDPQPAGTDVDYQWFVVDGGTASPIAGATDATYTPVAGHGGKVLRAQATLSNANYADRVDTEDTAAVGKADQSITFTSTAPTGAAVDGTYDVAATGGASGNPVTFTIAAGSSSVCSISGSTVTFDGIGNCEILADQAGNADYNAAPQASQTVAVGKAAQAITFTSTAPSGAIVGDTYDVAATGGASGNPVTFTIAPGSSSVCSISGSTVTFDGAGSCEVLADQAGNADYNAAPQASQTVAVGKAAQAITFTSTAPTGATVGDTYDVHATGGASGNPVTFTIAAGSSSVCSISGSTVTFTAADDCEVLADQAGDADYNAATQASQTVTVGKAAQAVTFTSTAPTGAVVGDTYDVTATGGASGNPVTFSITPGSSAVCSISGSTVTFDGAGGCEVLADQAGNADYNAAPQASQTVAVGKAAQAITFTSTAPTGATVGDSYDVHATGGASGNPVTFTIAAGSSGVCSISGATVTFNSTGGCEILADQAGNADYNAATQASQTVAVGKAAQAITFTSTAPTGAVVGDTYDVAATGGASGNPVTFTIAPGSSSVCSISGSTVTFNSAGGCEILADQAGNADYEPAVQASQTVTVVSQTADLGISSDGPFDLVAGGDPADLDLTVTNAGAADADGVVVDVELPDGVTLATTGASSLRSSSACTSTATGAACALGTVAAGQSVDLSLRLSAPDPAGAPASLSITATLSTDSEDAATSDDVVSSTIRLVAVGDLTMQLTPVLADGSSPSGFDVTVSNSGPSAAEGADVTFTLPSGVSLAAVPAGCTLTGDLVRCDLGAIGPESSADLSVRLIGDRSAATIEVTMSSDADDPTPAGSQQTVVIPEDPAPPTTVPPTTLPQVPVTELPATGTRSLGLLHAGLVSLLIGIVTVVGVRRRMV